MASGHDRIHRLRVLCGGDAVESSAATTPLGAVLPGKPAGIAALYRSHLDADFLERDELGASAAARSAQLRVCAAACAALAGRMACTLDLLAGINAQQAQASTKTRSLHTTCERLLKEQMDLEGEVVLLSKPLEYFDSLDSLAALLGMPLAARGLEASSNAERSSTGSRTLPGGTPTLHAGSEEFMAALVRIDECVAFLTSHPEYKEGAHYLGRYMQLRDRAMALVKNQVLAYLDQAARTAGEQTVTAGKLELSAVYSKFRAISHRVHELIDIIRHHAGSGSRRLLLEECEQCYLEKRLALLRPPVRQHLDGLSKVRELVACVRFGAAYLIRIGQLEARLYDSCMGSNAPGSPRGQSERAGEEKSALPGQKVQPDASDRPENAGLYDMLMALCEELYTHLRPRVLMGNDMNELCEVVGVVREEIVEEHRGRHGNSQVMRKRSGGGESIAIETVLSRLVQDAQERLIHCALRAIRFEIEEFHPRPEQLDYPALLAADSAKGSDGAATGGPAAAGGDGAAILGGAGDPAETPMLARTSAMAAYRSWYPPLRSALMILSKIYRAVDMAVFEDLAHHAVAATTLSLREGAAAIKRKSLQSALDSHLFLIKHLLTLREQLSPFDVSYAHRSTRLNFRPTRTALRKFVTTAPALFRLDKSNALVRVSVESLPSVDEFQVDAKRDMEDTLRGACSEFIVDAADVVREPLLGFLNKARAFQRAEAVPTLRNASATPESSSAMAQPSGGNVAGDDLQLLRAQPFTHVERVSELLASVADQSAEHLAQVMASMSLYLTSATTGVLIHPIQRRILETAHEVAALLQRLYTAEEYGAVAPLVARLSDAVLASGPAGAPGLASARSFSLYGSGHSRDASETPRSLSGSVA